ncbi:MAG: glutathione S-transferase family protein [Pseudomonadota bacterium]
MSMTLYHVPGSRSVRTLWLLREMGATFDVHELKLSLESLRDPAYLAISPLGRVPCLKDGDEIIFESGALTQYLCEKYNHPLMRAPGDPERGQWLQWLHYAETMAVHAASLVQQVVFIPKEDRSKAVSDVEKRRLGQALSVLNKHLEGQDYVLKSGFSAVDTNVGYSVQLAKGFIPIDNWENLVAYRERVIGRPAAQESLPENMRS